MTTQMDRMHALYGQPRDYTGTFRPLIATTTEPAKLIDITAAAGGVVVSMIDNGVYQTLLVTTLDAAGLDRLTALDRASVQSALVAMQREATDGSA